MNYERLVHNLRKKAYDYNDNKAEQFSRILSEAITIATQKDKRDYYSEQDKPKQLDTIIMITENHRITYARCIDSGMSRVLQVATIFKMVYDITDAEAFKLTIACADYYNETLTK